MGEQGIVESIASSGEPRRTRLSSPATHETIGEIEVAAAQEAARLRYARAAQPRRAPLKAFWYP